MQKGEDFNFYGLWIMDDVSLALSLSPFLSRLPMRRLTISRDGGGAWPPVNPPLYIVMYEHTVTAAVVFIVYANFSQLHIQNCVVVTQSVIGELYVTRQYCFLLKNCSLRDQNFIIKKLLTTWSIIMQFVSLRFNSMLDLNYALLRWPTQDFVPGAHEQVIHLPFRLLYTLNMEGFTGVRSRTSRCNEEPRGSEAGNQVLDGIDVRSSDGSKAHYDIPMALSIRWTVIIFYQSIHLCQDIFSWCVL